MQNYDLIGLFLQGRTLHYFVRIWRLPLKPLVNGSQVTWNGILVRYLPLMDKVTFVVAATLSATEISRAENPVSMQILWHMKPGWIYVYFKAAFIIQAIPGNIPYVSTDLIECIDFMISSSELTW